MDKSRFNERMTGRLLPVKHPRNDWAFLPELMPPRWEIPYGLWPLISEAKSCLGMLQGKCSQLESPELLLHPLQSREAMTSSQLEGTYVQAEQLLLYELESEDRGRNKEENEQDLQEVSNYTAALHYGHTALCEGRPLSLSLIKEMHKRLMRGARGADKSPGAFRSRPVKIGHDGRFIPPPTEHVVGLMEDLDKFIQDQVNLDRPNLEEPKHDPLVNCFLAHYQFETIHPFEDGNGRIGRLLLALMIMKCMGHSLPWLYMSAFFEKHKDEYTGLLFRVSSEGLWEDWIKFCIRGATWQAEDAIRRCDLLDGFRNSFRERLEHLGHMNVRLMEIAEKKLFVSPVVTVPHLKKKYRVHYQTAKRDIDALIEAGILSELPHSRPKAFYSHEIVQVMYGQPEEIQDMHTGGVGIADFIDNEAKEAPA